MSIFKNTMKSAGGMLVAMCLLATPGIAASTAAAPQMVTLQGIVDAQVPLVKVDHRRTRAIRRHQRQHAHRRHVRRQHAHRYHAPRRHRSRRPTITFNYVYRQPPQVIYRYAQPRTTYVQPPVTYVQPPVTYAQPRTSYRAPAQQGWSHIPSANLAAHDAWCDLKYRSYDARSKTLQPYNGPRKYCNSPYDRI